MNYNDFIQFKSLEGELKVYHRKQDMAMTVSDKELVFQKPHVNYHISLEHIVSIVPFRATLATQKVRFGGLHANGHELAPMSSGSDKYRLVVSQAIMHNRSGLFAMGQTEFIVPFAQETLQAVAAHGGLREFQ